LAIRGGISVRAQQWHKLLYYLFIAGCVAAGVIWAIIGDLSKDSKKEKAQAKTEVMSRGSAGVDLLWQVNDAERVFKEKNGRYGTLDELAASELLRKDLAAGPCEGYTVNVVPDGDRGYKATAYPAEYTTNRMQPSFFVDETGALRWRKCRSANDLPADASCEQIEQF
jgi:hypothetical protein